jgi:type VI secretion system ImpC/EvpB family protein
VTVVKPTSPQGSRRFRELLSSGGHRPRGRGDLVDFADAASPGAALVAWFGAEELRGLSLREVVLLLSRDIVTIDQLINEQVNAILHHERFQKLEASWRSLRQLVDWVDDFDEPDAVRVRALNISWRELVRDAERAVEFDQSELFLKIYNDGFGAAGGEPFGLLLGDYEVRHRPGPGHPHDDVAVLNSLAGVAAAAFAPIVLGAHPSLLGVDEFQELELPRDLAAAFESSEYVRWRSLRRSPDTRFLALTAPRVLVRDPYSSGARSDGFRFREDVGGVDGRRYLWGTAVYAFGAIVIRSFSESRWFVDLRGVRVGEEVGGLVPSLPHDGAGQVGLLPKPSTDVIVTSRLEKQLGELGLLTLCQSKGLGRAAFYSCDTIHDPPTHDDPAATLSEKLSSMLHYMLCVSRFAHYVKVIAREKVGTFTTPEACERMLITWLHQYTTGADDLSAEMMAKYPLKECRVDVREKTGQPGQYHCVVHLLPHFQIDQVVSSVKLVTDVAAMTGGS